MYSCRSMALAALLLIPCIGASSADAQGMRPADMADDTAQRVDGYIPNVDEGIAVALSSPGGTVLDLLAGSLSRAAAVPTNWHLSVESGGSNSIEVAPGAEVRYEVIGVLSDDATEGLALVTFNLVFDGGDLAQADSPTGWPTPGCDDAMVNFTKPWGITNPAGYGGTPIDGDLIQVGGAQNTMNNPPSNVPFPIGPVLTGVAGPGGCGAVVVASGSLTAPKAVGTYTLALTEPFVNVILEGETGEPFWATAAASIGMITPLSVSVSSGRAIPAVSEWGIVVMTLLGMVVGTILLGSRGSRHYGAA